MACYGEYEVTKEEFYSNRQWRPLIYRKCTDIPWLVIFFLFWAGMMFITGYAIVAGAAERLIFGYDSYGNICGRKNSPIEGAPLSGLDMVKKKNVFFLDSCNLEINGLKVNSIALCVSSCPQEQLNTLEEVQLFGRDNGSYLCVYNLNYSEYTVNPKAAKLCPKLPVPPSKSFPLFNRCVPQNPQCYSQFVGTLVSVVNEMDFFHRIIGGIMASRDNIIGLCILSLVLSLIVVVTFRFIATVLVHIFITLVTFGLLFVSGILWWLYYDHVHDPGIALETEKENAKFLLGFAIVATVMSVIILFLLLVLRKRIQLAKQLLQVASKVVSSVPLLLLQPLWTFIILILFWVYWVAVLLSLGTAGNAQVISGGQVEYKPLSGIRYMWWYHLVGLIWTGEFILACQQMTIAGAVVINYFNRDRNNPPRHAILSSISNLFSYHLGTVVKGSFIIALVRIPRVILLYIHDTLKGKENNCAKCMFKCCTCCLCCLEKGLRYLNQNAYIAVAINGTNFCTSAKEAFFILGKNLANVATINCFGDFLLFLGKVFVVCFTIFGGLMAFNYHRELHVWVIPLLLVSFFSYLVAHCFLSVFEMVVDVLFLCYAVDLETNDGSPDKPYFMDKELMKLINKSNEAAVEIANKNKVKTRNHEDGTELQPMTK
ncbi:choline transporter-like protein 3 [Latimeria chalumnae]|uniref:Choline transporter-like protein n=1 Tax=Latimeria chalumnae TaxID=7897 RepID=M3XIQ0_LATCH|nr:PREDICTED: choline transporter-like protein 3 isoform X1 [Latimeria chalumnae]|eukprot:XP_006005756.1 PREDICTED: choline transporter-like protein 3 isoform X1 [Latimeria chalumnae]